MDENFTIEIAPSLVKQLAGSEAKLKRRVKKPKQKIQQGTQQPETKGHKTQTSDSFESHEVTVGAGGPLQPPPFLRVPPAPPQGSNVELEAIRYVIQEVEKVLERLKKQEENISQKVTQRAKELHDKEFKLPFQKPMPCLTEKDACLDCYKEYAKDPLKCAEVIRRFAACARIVRQQVSAPHVHTADLE